MCGRPEEVAGRAAGGGGAGRAGTGRGLLVGVPLVGRAETEAERSGLGSKVLGPSGMGLVAAGADGGGTGEAVDTRVGGGAGLETARTGSEIVGARLTAPAPRVEARLRMNTDPSRRNSLPALPARSTIDRL